MIELEHIKFSDCKSMPWKNGKGTTKQIKIFPENSSIQNNNFLWRLSSAEVCESGPFSIFKDYQRLLTVLEGKGLTLSFENNKNNPFAHIDAAKFVEFDGSKHIFCQLIGEKVLDLNLIYHRKHIKAECILMNSSLNQFEFSSEADIIFAIDDFIQINTHSTNIQLNKYDTTIIKNSPTKTSATTTDNITITPHQNARYILMRLNKIL